MRNLDHLVGQHAGRWLILAVDSHGSRGYLLCVCECGTRRSVRVNRLEDGTSKSCGCLAAELSAKRKRRHGYRPSGVWNTTYKSWQGMRERCLNRKNKGWPRYGGRGIAICERWNEFENFLEDMGERPAQMSLDRIDNDGNYEPANCRWATDKQQSNNTRANRILELDGTKRTLSEWAEATGLTANAIRMRLANGWPVRRALETPISDQHQRASKERHASPD
jgi:hypothetical protein